LAELASRPKPWMAEGISRRTWERRRKANPDMMPCVSGNQRSVSQGESEIIVFKQRTHVASPNMRNPRKEGLHEGALIGVERRKRMHQARLNSGQTLRQRT